MEILNYYVNFLTDSSRKFSHKVIFTLSIVFSILLIDNYVGFSFYFKSERKISQLKNLQAILKDPTLTEFDREKLIHLKYQILFREDILQQAINNLKHVSLTKTVRNEEVKVNEMPYNKYLHFITSSWSLLIMMAIFVIAIPFSFTRGTNIIAILFALVFLELFLFGISYFLSWLLNLIPIILSRPWINYSLNVILNFLLIVVPLVVVQRKEKRNKRASA